MIRWGWLFAISGLLAARGAAPFAQEGSDLAPDPAARFGVLPNGLRYMIVPHSRANDHVSLRLLVKAGSRQETDPERGLAHFLEHMAFNGSTHYPPGTLVKRLQRMGMRFGPDANADTDFNRTLYLLDLPDHDRASLTEGFQILADYAGSLLIRPEMIDKERGIILSEIRARDSVHRRSSQARREFCLAGTRYPVRRPIGLVQVVQHVQRAQFVDFYNTWYRPERMVVLVVGEVDPAAMAKEITSAFAGLRPRAPPRPDPDLGELRPGPALNFDYFPVPEEPGPSVSVSAVAPFPDGPDSAAVRQARLCRKVAQAIFIGRLAVLARRDDSPFASGTMTVREHDRFYREARIELGCKRRRWKEGLEAAEQELRQALQFGFQPEEVREAAATLEHELVESAKDAPDRTAKEIADELVHSLLDQEVFLSPGQKLALLKPVLEKLSPEDCTRAFRAVWSAPRRFVFVYGAAEIKGDATAQIRYAYERSQKVAVKPPAPVLVKAWTYTDFGPPGAVAQRAEVADLGLSLVTFANGVRLNLKPTRFEIDRIEILVRFGTGEIGEPSSLPGLGYFASQVFIAGGLARYSEEDLHRIFAGKSLAAEFIVADDAFSFRGSTDRRDLAQEMQLLAAEFTEPGYRPEAESNARVLIASHYYSMAHLLTGPLAATVPRLLANGDVRIGLPPPGPLLNRTLGEVERWLAPQLRNGPVEITLIGDFDSDAGIAAVSRTFGALAPREPKPSLTKLRRVSFPSRTFHQIYSIPTEIPTALVAIYWPTDDGTVLHRADCLHLLARVLEDRLRLKVREQLGDTYTPSAGSIASETYPHYGYFQAQVTVDPAKAGPIAGVMIALGAELAANGVPADDLERARQPILATLREAVGTNRYWLNLLSAVQEKPATLERPRRQLADFESISKSDLDRLARAYLVRQHAFQVVVRPILKPSGVGAN